MTLAESLGLSIADPAQYARRVATEAVAYRHLAEVLAALTGLADPFAAVEMLVDRGARAAGAEADREAPTMRPAALTAARSRRPNG